MSESLNPAPNVDSKAELPQEACCAMANPFSEVALRAAIYVPALLLTSAFAAAAVFPDLAEYVTPLLDMGSKCPATISGSSTNSGPCCQQAGKTSSCSGSASDTANPQVPAASADEIPADAMAAVNIPNLGAASN